MWRFCFSGMVREKVLSKEGLSVGKLTMSIFLLLLP
jgi:hypothetical protein